MGVDIKIGEFQTFNPPNGAEELILHQYEKHSPTGKSVGGYHCYNTVFICPKCGKESEFHQSHGDAYICGDCGLARQSFGNLLYVWNNLKEIRKAKLLKLINDTKDKTETQTS